MKKLAIIGTIAATAMMAGISAYRLHEGIPVKPLVSADFNGDGRDDVIYSAPASPFGPEGLVFVDGRYVSNKD
jgi:hypothetical protein